jgi:hypothetical protein
MQQASGRPDPYGNVTRVVNRWEHVMRIRFLSYLAMGITSAFLIVSSYAFAEGTFMWLAFAGGIALAVSAAIDVVNSRTRPLTAAPAVLIAVVGVVMTVLAVTLRRRTSPTSRSACRSRQASSPCSDCGATSSKRSTTCGRSRSRPPDDRRAGADVRSALAPAWNAQASASGVCRAIASKSASV